MLIAYALLSALDRAGCAVLILWFRSRRNRHQTECGPRNRSPRRLRVQLYYRRPVL